MRLLIKVGLISFLSLVLIKRAIGKSKWAVQSEVLKRLTKKKNHLILVLVKSARAKIGQ